MYSQLTTSPHNGSISIHTYQGSPALITNENAFTIVLLQHFGNIRINFNTLELKGYAILFLCPDEVLELTNYTSLKTIVFTGDKTLKNTEKFNFAYGNIHKLFIVSNTLYHALSDLFSKISELITHETLGLDCAISNVINSILEISPTYTGLSCNKDYALVYDFINLVHEHYTMYHQMSFYSRLLKVPSKRITEKFKSLDVMTPHAFIKNRVITEIKRQLCYTDKTVKTICFDVGFNDPAYFARFFKKNEGITATAYRAKYQTKIVYQIN